MLPFLHVALHLFIDITTTLSQRFNTTIDIQPIHLFTTDTYFKPFFLLFSNKQPDYFFLFLGYLPDRCPTPLRLISAQLPPPIHVCFPTISTHLLCLHCLTIPEPISMPKIADNLHCTHNILKQFTVLDQQFTVEIVLPDTAHCQRCFLGQNIHGGYVIYDGTGRSQPLW